MRSVILLIIGFVLLSSCSIAFVFNEKIELSGKLDAKTNDELAQDSAKGSGDQAYTRTLESDYGYSRLFSRYINEVNGSLANQNEPNSYSMNMDAYGVNHGISFSGGKIASSNLIKIDDTSGVASYFNMVADGKMDESLKNILDNRNIRGNNLGNDLASTHVEGQFSLSSTYTDTKTAQDDKRQLLSELEEIDVDLKLNAESGDQDLNATKMQDKIGSDLAAGIENPDISPDQVIDKDTDSDLAIGFGSNVTDAIGPGDWRRGLELMNTAAFNELKSDKIFAYNVRPKNGTSIGPIKATRVTPLKLGRFPV
jgi:hypothetical protein